MKKALTYALLLLISARLFAEHVEPATALKVANTFMPEARFEQHTRTSYNNIYIFNGENCFVIVSADDRVQPILLYSKDNTLDVENIPENISEQIQNWNEKIQTICDNNIEATDEIIAKWEYFTKTYNHVVDNGSLDVKEDSITYREGWIHINDWENWETIIPFGDAIPTYNTPFNNYYKNSWNETIYPQSIFKSECMIKSITYTCVNPQSYTCSSLKIYMGERNSDGHSSNTDWTPLSDLQLVYSGTNITVGESDGQAIDLDVPFKYTKTGNLVIVVSKTAPSCTSSLKWGYSPAQNSCLYRQSDSNTSYADYPNGANGSLSNERADISLTVNYDFYPQDIIVETGTTPSYKSPFDNYYTYSWNEMIYPKSYFPNPCTINSLSFYCTDASYYTCRNLDIYMGKRPSDAHASTSDWINPSNLQLVYSASGKVIGDQTGWQEFVLDTPYDYYPDENLVVVVAKAGYSWTDQLKWSCSDTNRSLCRQSDTNSSIANSYPNGSSGQLVPQANVKFSVEYGSQPSVITIGNGTTASYSSPFDNYYKYSWNESIYPSSSLPSQCTITSVSYNCKQASYYTCKNLDIYMGVINKSQHNSTSDWINPSSLRLVYSESGEVLGRQTGWQEFILDTPFEYNGNGNLVIVVAKAGYSWTDALKWECAGTNNKSLCLQSDRVNVSNSYPNGQNGVYAPLANVKLGLRNGRSGEPIVYQEIEISENSMESEMANVEEINEINIFPNPAHNVINIEMEDNNFEYVIYNELGQVVRQGKSCGKSQINVEDCQKGLYLIKITTEEKTSTHKIVIE